MCVKVVYDKVVCEKVVCEKVVCDKVVCDKVVGDKVVCVTELCVNVCEDAEADAERSGGGDLKTRTPHNFVGKKTA